MTRPVRCPQCRTLLSPGIYNSGAFHECPGCRQPTRVDAFPALLSPPAAGRAAEGLIVEGESSCFFHPAKRASVACESCGRFLCSVCDIELAGQHLCSQCLESGKKKGRLQQLENRRTIYDSMALAFATYPLLIFYFTIITAPIALYLTARYWKAPGSLVRRNRWRFVVASILATCQLVGWVVGIVALSKGS